MRLSVIRGLKENFNYLESKFAIELFLNMSTKSVTVSEN